MWIGPRNSLIAALLGKTCYWPTDQSEWVIIPSLRWDDIRDEYPELWAHKIHDFVAEEMDEG